MEALLDRAFANSDYHAKRERFARENPGGTDQARHRICLLHARSGIYRLGRSLSGVRGGTAEATREGIVRVLAASTEIGQGTNTIFSQIAADALGIGYDRIEIAQPDTGAVPNSGPTVASRTIDGRRQTGGDCRARLKQTLLESGLLCDACTEVTEFGGAVPALHRNARRRCVRGAKYRASARPALGRRKISAAMPTARMPGPCMWPKSPWTR